MEIKLLNTTQAAEFLGIHPMTLKIKAQSGEIPAGRSGKKWIFVNVDLIEYIRAQYQAKDKAAQSRGMKLTEWIVSALNDAAKR